MTAADLPTVFIVDDDARMRAALQRLLKTVGLRLELHGTPEEFLLRKPPNGPSYLVLDMRLPGMSGLDLQRKLTEVGVWIPVIFIASPRRHSHDGPSHEVRSGGIRRNHFGIRI